MCKTTGSTETEYILRENMENYDYFSLFIFFICAWLLVLKN